MIDLSNGDVRDLLSNIPDDTIDCVCIDPPYPTISGGSGDIEGHNRPKGMLSSNDGKIFEHNEIAPDEYLSELYRILRTETHMYLMTNFLNLEEFMRKIREAGFDIHNLLIWKKNNTVTNRWYMKNCEYTIFARKGRAKGIKNAGSQTVHEIDNIIGNKVHPTEKPVDLMKLYVENSTDEGDLVLDCFMGGGSTGVACVETGRNFIGIEKSKDFFDIAHQRIYDAKYMGGGIHKLF